MKNCARLIVLFFFAGFAQSSLSEDDLLGSRVFWKESAFIKNGTMAIDMYKVLSIPAKVKEVKGDMLRLERYWINKSDCMQLNEAFDFYVEEVRKNPESSRAYLHRGACWLEKGEPGNAINDFDEAVRLDQGFAVAFKFRGDAKTELKEYVGAIDDYNQAIRLDPKYTKAYGMRGNAKYNLNDFIGAIYDFDLSIELDPTIAFAYNARGNAKSDLKDYDGAIADYDEFIRLEPTDAIGYYNRGIAKSDLKDFTDAIQDFDEAIRLDPKFSWAYNSRGNANYNLRDFTRAIDDFDQSIQLDPTFASAYNARGIAKCALEDYLAAIQDYDEAIRFDPKFALAYSNRGITHTLLENYSAAIKDLDKALRLNLRQPYARYARSIEAFLLATVEDASVRNADLAMKLADEVLSEDPANVWGMNAKACALAAMGDYDSAIALQESITDSEWLEEKNILGGIQAKKRISAWKSGKQWQLTGRANQQQAQNSDSSDRVQLAWKFIEGQATYYTYEEEATRNEHLGGRVYKTVDRAFLKYKWEVLFAANPPPAGIQVTFEQVRHETVTPARTIVTDTYSPLSPKGLSLDAKNQQDEIYRILQTQYVFLAHPYAGVVWPDKLSKDGRPVESDYKTPDAFGFFSPDKFTTGDAISLPDREIQMGDEWTKYGKGLNSVTSVGRYRAIGRVNRLGYDCWQIEGTTTYDPISFPENSDITELKAGPRKSMCFFDADKGRLVLSNESTPLHVAFRDGRVIDTVVHVKRQISQPPSESELREVSRDRIDGETRKFWFKEGLPVSVQQDWLKVVSSGLSMQGEQIKEGEVSVSRIGWVLCFDLTGQDIKSIRLFDVTQDSPQPLEYQRLEGGQEDFWVLLFNVTAIEAPEAEWFHHDVTSERIIKVVAQNKKGETKTLYQPIFIQTLRQRSSKGILIPNTSGNDK